MRIIVSISLAFIAMLSFSCKNEATQQKLNAIQVLQNQVDSSDVVYQKINIEGIKKFKAKSASQLDYLEEFYHDTILENARYVDVYYANFKLMRKLIKGHDRLGQEINFSKSQLTHLYNDVKNGFAMDSTYQRHFDGEKKAVRLIKNTAATLIDWEGRSVNRYNGMNAPIDSIILHLQNQGFR